MSPLFSLYSFIILWIYCLSLIWQGHSNSLSIEHKWRLQRCILSELASLYRFIGPPFSYPIRILSHLIHRLHWAASYHNRSFNMELYQFIHLSSLIPAKLLPHLNLIPFDPDLYWATGCHNRSFNVALFQSIGTRICGNRFQPWYQ
jgi:hypothetical protein